MICVRRRWNPVWSLLLALLAAFLLPQFVREFH
jgi:hypothetical protein